MKTIITKNKKWTSVVLLGLATFTYSQTYTNDTSAEMVTDVIIPYFEKQTNILSSFFDASKKTSYKVHIDHIDKNAKEYSATIERYKRTTMAVSPLFALTLKLAHYIEEKMAPLFGVMRKYIGKKDFVSFVADLKKILQKDIIFKEITEFLTQFSDLAKTEHNTAMLDAIEKLHKVLDRKTLEWTSKKDQDLLMGICTRMKH